MLLLGRGSRRYARSSCRNRKSPATVVSSTTAGAGHTRGGSVKRTTRWGGLAVRLAAAVGVAAIAGATGGHAATDAKKPIVIGWAFDSKGNMAPFDDPALAAAKIRVKQINAKGGIGGRHLAIKTCDTQNNNPVTAK